MEKNENKFMSKAKSFLVLVLFTIIYIFLQKIISAAFFLFLIYIKNSNLFINNLSVSTRIIITDKNAISKLDL